MKIECTISSVASNGEHLTITANGWDDADPDGELPRPVATFSVRDNKARNRKFHVGRKLTITIEPER